MGNIREVLMNIGRAGLVAATVGIAAHAAQRPNELPSPVLQVRSADAMGIESASARLQKLGLIVNNIVEPQCAEVADITIIGSCELRPGETRYVPSGTLVVGDVFANGFRLFDDMAQTGLMVVVTNPGGAEIQAPYGANVLFLGGDREVRSEIIGNKVQEMMETGCQPGGCEWVKVSRDP